MVARTTTKTAAPKSNADLLMRIAELEGDNAALLRNSKPAKTAAKPVTPIEPVTANVDADEADAATWLQRMRQSADGFMASIEMPSWTRRIVSTLIGLTTTASVFYGSMALLDMLLAGVMVYTGAGFISFIVVFIGMFIAVMAAVTAGSKVYGFCMEFEFSAVRSRVSKFFAPKQRVAAAA